MTPKRIYYGLIGAIVLLFIALLAGAYGVNSLFVEHANNLTQLKAKSQALSQEQASLANAQKEVAKYAGLEQIAKSIVPEDKDQAEAVQELVKIAAANGMSLSSITFPASSLGASGPGSSATTTSSSAASPAPVASAASASASAKAGKLSQLQPVKNIPGVYILQITVQSDPNKPVSYSSFINFLNDLEHNRRTAQITSVSLQPSANNSSLLTDRKSVV